MLTDDKRITEAAYWDAVYSGNNMNAKVDSSNTIRPPQTFDRFDIVVKHVLPEEKKILDIGSGHARICERINRKWPEKTVIASDQSNEAKKIANYEPYIILDAYKLTFPDKWFDLIICSQAMEYLEDQYKFLDGVKRVSKKFLCTVPKGEMSSWSQLRIYDKDNLTELLEAYGTIEIFEDYEHLMLAKIKFYS